MASSAEQIRNYRGPALLSYGFRPFFLAGSIWAAVTVALWLPFLAGEIMLPTAFAPLDWHIHELLFGYLPAIVSGFLLTAVPNWTGRLPVVGARLLVLFSTWVAGRAAVLCSAVIGWQLAAAVDLSFLLLLMLVIGREILAGRNWRNAKMLALLALLWTASGLHHLESALIVSTDVAPRLGISVAVLMVALIGGRIIPSFTRNWLARRVPGRMPEPFARVDMAAIAVAAIALASWTIAPDVKATAVLALMAAIAHAMRLARWAGERTVTEPLVLVLHVAYAFVPLGFLLTGITAWNGDAAMAGAGVHAWTAGVIGLMTVAVMTRASLGHTGQPLIATRAIRGIYVLLLIAALSRVAAGLDVARDVLLAASALGWVAAFALFAAVYWPLLTRRAAAR